MIRARMAETGGWSPAVIRARVGEPLHLKFTSEDVMHGFAVGQMALAAVDIEPGKVSETTLTFQKPGIYTFYCTRWCGPNHWRMRGTIEVSGAGSGNPEPASRPLYVDLGLNLDTPHPADIIPVEKPSASRGQVFLSRVPDPSTYQSTGTYRSHSPVQIFMDLGTTRLTDLQRWDVVVAIWAQNTSAAGLADGKELYAQNCAACHGESGAGDGVYADTLAAMGAESQVGMSGTREMSIKKPVNFTKPDLLGASPALLQGKILRGGMGTGMPMWGSIFSDEQIWNLVAYLYTFQFK